MKEKGMRKIGETRDFDVYIILPEGVLVIDKRTGEEFELSPEEFETYIGY